MANLLIAHLMILLLGVGNIGTLRARIRLIMDEPMLGGLQNVDFFLAMEDAYLG